MNFARSVPGAEIIDELTLTPEQRELKKADVFFDGRAVITEVKVLETDTAPKVDPILGPYRDSEQWPIFYGQRPISKILEHLPDREKLHRKIYNAITSSLENIVADANRQIRETKQSFALPASGGLLVILNDTIDILDPNVMAHRVGQALLKRTSTGKPRFPEVGAAWLLCETHLTPIPGMRGGLLAIIIPNPQTPLGPGLDAYIDRLQERWAAFNRVPLFRTTMPVQDLSRVPLQPMKVNPESQQITRSELWRQEYRASPHLRSLTREQLLDYGERVMDDAARQFAVGAPKATPEQMDKMGRDSTAFFEEIEARNMDMRELTRHVEKKKRGGNRL